MRTHAYTLVQFCASAWAWSLGVWAAPMAELQVEHRGTEDLGAVVLLPAESPLGNGVMPGGSFMWSGQDGSYRFGLQSEDQWRMESRNVDGIVEGRYVYKNPEGQTVDISYNAGPQGFIAEGDAIPGGRAPLVDAPINDDVNQVLEPVKPFVEEVEGIPYGALRVSSLKGFQPVVRDDNIIEDLKAQAIIISSLSGFQSVAPDDSTLEDLEDWPPNLTFNRLPHRHGLPLLRGEPTRDIFGPPILEGKKLESVVIEF